jgi:hypothetical protein
VLASLAAVAVAATVTVGGTPAAQATTRTPVMQPSTLGPADLVRWFRDHEPSSITYRALVPLEDLARYFVEEGAAEGVAGDLAFAQSVLETGWFRWPSHGQVTPTHHNFSGIGACDGGTCTVARFRTARIGVRAQIQHLRAYADPTVTANNLAHPLESPRFHLVTPKGRAPYWERFGGGNWATDPAYGEKILRLHRSMLPYASAQAATFQRFRDVAPADTHHDAIVRLTDAGVVRGCTATTFCPQGSLTRAQMASLLARALALPAADGPRFPDVEGSHTAAVTALAAAGIADGYPDGTFRPHDPVTRAQLASFLAAAFDLPDRAHRFPDVRPGDPHAGAIGAASGAGLVGGFADGTFRPGQAVTRAQAASMLDRALAAD